MQDLNILPTKKHNKLFKNVKKAFSSILHVEKLVFYIKLSILHSENISNQSPKLISTNVAITTSDKYIVSNLTEISDSDSVAVIHRHNIRCLVCNEILQSSFCYFVARETRDLSCVIAT